MPPSIRTKATPRRAKKRQASRARRQPPSLPQEPTRPNTPEEISLHHSGELRSGLISAWVAVFAVYIVISIMRWLFHTEHAGDNPPKQHLRNEPPGSLRYALSTAANGVKGYLREHWLDILFLMAVAIIGAAMYKISLHTPWLYRFVVGTTFEDEEKPEVPYVHPIFKDPRFFDPSRRRDTESEQDRWDRSAGRSELRHRENLEEDRTDVGGGRIGY